MLRFKIMVVVVCLSLAGLLFLVGCGVQDLEQSHAVCQAATEQCESRKLTCSKGFSHVTLDCGCGCLPISDANAGQQISTSVKQRTTSTSSHSNRTEGGTISGVKHTLPPSDRVFSLDLDGNGTDELIAAQGAKVWLYRPTSQELVDLVIPSKGVLQSVTVGQWKGKRSVFLGFGRGRGMMDAPVEIFVSGPECSNWLSVFRFESKRSDISGLSYLGADYGAQAGLLVSFYTSKYLVETIRLTDAGRELMHGAQRMAGNVMLWQIPGGGPAVKVVGRIYGDKRGVSGDLSLYQSGQTPQRLVIQGGVRALRVAQTSAGKRARLYVSDGWAAAYAKEAKAQLKEVRYDNGGFIVSQIGGSTDEYTFFDLWARDLNGDGVDEIVARGNRYLTQFTRTNEGWRSKRLMTFGPVLNVALLKLDAQAAGRWAIIVPDVKSTRVIMKTSQEVAL